MLFIVLTIVNFFIEVKTIGEIVLKDSGEVLIVVNGIDSVHKLTNISLIVNSESNSNPNSKFDNYIISNSKNIKYEVSLNEDIITFFKNKEKIQYKTNFFTSSIRDLFDTFSEFARG